MVGEPGQTRNIEEETYHLKAEYVRARSRERRADIVLYGRILLSVLLTALAGFLYYLAFFPPGRRRNRRCVECRNVDRDGAGNLLAEL